jgi:alcohol dehydrogenase class IV
MTTGIDRFALARTPRLLFGAGRIAELPKLVAAFGKTALLVTAQSSTRRPAWLVLRRGLEDAGVRQFHALVTTEPSPEFVDATAAEYRPKKVDVVVAIGGGSALDAGKAVAAMLRQQGSVVDYLEGVGDPARLSGARAGLIAVPTTAGTGSEATKNAVLSRVGPNGFKKSLRHDDLVPDVALVDPELTLPCPPELTAACGLDAFTQLLEAYVSTGASPLTDALAESGIERLIACLPRAVRHGETDLAARTGMAYAAFLSGVTLANAGLGTVHGLAGAIGGLFAAPHGVVCGTLMGAVVAANVHSLVDTHAEHAVARRKYAQVGRWMMGRPELDEAAACHALVDALHAWIDDFHLPRLGAFGITDADLDRLVDAAENKSNPVALAKDEMRTVLAERL